MGLSGGEEEACTGESSSNILFRRRKRTKKKKRDGRKACLNILDSLALSFPNDIIQGFKLLIIPIHPIFGWSHPTMSKHFFTNCDHIIIFRKSWRTLVSILLTFILKTLFKSFIVAKGFTLVKSKNQFNFNYSLWVNENTWNHSHWIILILI